MTKPMAKLKKKHKDHQSCTAKLQCSVGQLLVGRPTMFGMSCFTTKKDEQLLPAFLELFPYMHVNTLFSRWLICYSPIWCWSQRLERSSLSLVSNATLAIEQPSQGTLGTAIPTFNSTQTLGAKCGTGVHQQAACGAPNKKRFCVVYLFACHVNGKPLGAKTSKQNKNIQRRGRRELVAWCCMCVWLRVSCMRLLRRPRCSKTTLHARPGKTLPWKRWSPWANQRPPTAAIAHDSHDTFCNTTEMRSKSQS